MSSWVSLEANKNSRLFFLKSSWFISRLFCGEILSDLYLHAAWICEGYSSSKALRYIEWIKTDDTPTIKCDNCRSTTPPIRLTKIRAKIHGFLSCYVTRPDFVTMLSSYHRAWSAHIIIRDYLENVRASSHTYDKHEKCLHSLISAKTMAMLDLIKSVLAPPFDAP